MTNEELYDTTLAPLLLHVATLCQQHDLPFFASVEYAPDSWGDTQVKLYQSDTMAMTGFGHVRICR